MIRSLIVICTGNICRSPMAEALFTQRLSNNGKPIQISSAGIAALRHYPADPLAKLVMEEHGVDISSHRARQATQDMLLKCDLILTLDQTHSEWIRSRFPALQGRVHKLGRWRNNIDIVDPYGERKDVFDQVYREIEHCTDEWTRRIRPA